MFFRLKISTKAISLCTILELLESRYVRKGGIAMVMSKRIRQNMMKRNSKTIIQHIMLGLHGGKRKNKKKTEGVTEGG